MFVMITHVPDASQNMILCFFQQLPVAVRTDLDLSLTALRTRFVNNELQEIHVLKLENQKFDTKTDTPENFLVQLQALQKKHMHTIIGIALIMITKQLPNRLPCTNSVCF